MKRILLIIDMFLLVITCAAQSNITKGEYFIDTDPGAGHGNPISIVSPSTDLTIGLSLSTTGILPGFHTLNYRFMSAPGTWGLTSSQLFSITAPVVVPAQILTGEYFIDSDPGLGKGSAFTVTNPSSNATFSYQLAWNNLPAGLHVLNFRFRDQNGIWSEISSQLIYVESQPETLTSLVYGEYFFDQDPGAGNGSALSFSPGTSLSFPATINLPPLTQGFHNLQIRFKDQTGRWTETESQPLFVQAGDSTSRVVRAEYFVDSDPGVGKGIKISVPAPASDLTLSPSLKTDSLQSNLVHNLNFRFQDSRGNWGIASGLPFYVGGNQVEYFTPVNKIEYHLDGDTSKSNLRIDSVGLVMHGAKQLYDLVIQPVNSPGIGRHFVYARGIDFFEQYSPAYDKMKFVVSDDTSMGMLLGTAMAPDSSILNSGSVEVYNDVPGQLTFYKSLAIDNTGNFLTSGLEPGSYLLLLKPDISKFPNTIDTYFELEPQWERGTDLVINSDSRFNDVQVKALETKSLGGSSSLSGFITQSNKKSGGITINPDKVTGNPVKSASIILIGRNKGVTKVYAKAVSDQNGYYIFSNVPIGAYDLLVDILGVPQLDHYSVDVKDSSSSIQNLNYLVGGSGIYIASVTDPQDPMKVLIYPNPSHGNLHVLFPDEQGKVLVKVYDLSGRMVYSSQLESEAGVVYPLDMQVLPPGMYTIEFSGRSRRETQKIIIQ